MSKNQTNTAIDFLTVLKDTLNLNKKNLLRVEDVLRKDEVTKEEIMAVEKIVHSMRQANTMVITAIDNIIKSHYTNNN